MFLVCGEALFDLFLRPSEDDSLCLDAVPGGSPFNVALGLARLGQNVEFFSGLSSDLMGRKLTDFMRKEGVGLSHAVRSKQPTALSIVGLDADGSPDYAFYGDFPAYRAITQADLPSLAPETRVIHIGSIATALEPVASALAALAERECGSRLISYDPNVRPMIEPDLDVWRWSFERLAAAAHIIKISAEDLAFLYPGLGHNEAAQSWRDRGARLVVITRGRDGATGWTRATTATQPAHKVTVADTVGAGDSYQAALLTGLAEIGCTEASAIDELSPEALCRLLEFAGEAAALTCSKRGADLPHRGAIAIGPLSLVRCV
jgi:fructokinase